MKDHAALLARLFRNACLAELAALKPGNVHRHGGSPRHGLTLADFERSAIAAAPALARPHPGLGRRILAAAAATRAAVGTNTNLGILLLCAPLVEAALVRRRGEPLREAVVRVLAAATVEDTAALYAAIRLARPGGMGRAARFDLATTPRVPPHIVMAAAEGYDRIARNWVRGLGDLFDRTLPLLRRLKARGLAPATAVTGLHLALLAAFPDTLICRRHGMVRAQAVRRRAAALWRRFSHLGPGVVWPELRAFDRALAARGLNPGTSADLVVATLFAEALLVGLYAPRPHPAERVSAGRYRCQTTPTVQGRGYDKQLRSGRPRHGEDRSHAGGRSARG